jgi:hypothetical protein
VGWGYVGWRFPVETHFDSLTGKAIVLDWSTNDRMEEVKISERVGNSSAGLTQMDLALSPDGKYLPVLPHHKRKYFGMVPISRQVITNPIHLDVKPATERSEFQS